MPDSKQLLTTLICKICFRVILEFLDFKYSVFIIFCLKFSASSANKLSTYLHVRRASGLQQIVKVMAPLSGVLVFGRGSYGKIVYMHLSIKILFL